MPKHSPRIAREQRTVTAMIAIYCHAAHGTEEELCAGCQQLHAYVMARLEHCPYQERKPTCAKCPVHCYKPDMRGQIKAVMRFSGPRMLRQHPRLALRHLIDGWRQPPARLGPKDRKPTG